jgi:hypothetical protein
MPALQNFPMLGETNNQFYLALLKGLYIFYYLRTRKFIGIVFHNWFTSSRNRFYFEVYDLFIIHANLPHVIYSNRLPLNKKNMLC